MSVACPITKGSNAINIYDPNFDDQKLYEIWLTDKDFCEPPVIVDVDGVSFCKDNAKLSFVLPCMDVGDYILEVAEKGEIDAIYKFNSIYTI